MAFDNEEVGSMFGLKRIIGSSSGSRLLGVSVFRPEALFCQHVPLTHFHHCTTLSKDKNFKDTPAAPRKSKFETDESASAPKIRTEEEKKKLNEERKQREEKKQAIRAKQLEIQAKRNASSGEKKTKKLEKDKAKNQD